jgi:hypothetical protein
MQKCRWDADALAVLLGERDGAAEGAVFREAAERGSGGLAGTSWDEPGLVEIDPVRGSKLGLLGRYRKGPQILLVVLETARQLDRLLGVLLLRLSLAAGQGHRPVHVDDHARLAVVDHVRTLGLKLRRIAYLVGHFLLLLEHLEEPRARHFASVDVSADREAGEAGVELGFPRLEITLRPESGRGRHDPDLRPFGGSAGKSCVHPGEPPPDAVHIPGDGWVSRVAAAVMVGPKHPTALFHEFNQEPTSLALSSGWRSGNAMSNPVRRPYRPYRSFARWETR